MCIKIYKEIYKEIEEGSAEPPKELVGNLKFIAAHVHKGGNPVDADMNITWTLVPPEATPEAPRPKKTMPVDAPPNGIALSTAWPRRAAPRHPARAVAAARGSPHSATGSARRARAAAPPASG